MGDGGSPGRQGESEHCLEKEAGVYQETELGEVYTTPGLLATGGTQLSQRGKRILGHELAGLIERALNYVQRGKGTSPSSVGMSPGSACQGQG